MKQLALAGGSKLRTSEFYRWPHVDERELQNVEEVVRSQRWFAGMRGADPGTKTEELEHRFADFHDSHYGIACCNGTVALEIALRAAGIGVGDEVIVPGLTFIATLSAVLQVNAIPIVVDTVYDTQCINPSEIERAITDRTRAIIPVHFGGLVCDMDRIMDIGRRHGLVVIEDAAHAPGAVQQGNKVGSIGHLATFSFQESKTMTAGEGGMITTNDPELAEKAVMFRSCGRKEGESWYVHYVMAVNYRLAEIQSAMLLAQLERLGDQLRIKNENAAFLAAQFERMDGIRPVPGDGKTDIHWYYLYLLQYDREKFSGLSRNRFVEALEAEGIPCHIGYPWPLTKSPMFQSIGQGAEGCPFTCPYYGKQIDIAGTDLPVIDKICADTVVIPHQVLLSPKEDLLDIGRAVVKIQKNASEIL